MRILIAAGSSGGHIFPALATASCLKGLNEKAEIVFIGAGKKLDRQIFTNEGYKFDTLRADKKAFLANIVSSFFILKKRRPDIVVGFGGYCSVFVLTMARFLGRPVVIHEQNLIPGLANRLLANFASRIAVSFDETRGCFKRASVVRHIGNPIRENLVKLDKTDAAGRFGLSADKFTVLIMGGSQGAHFINKAVLDMLKGLGCAQKGRLQIIHLTGARDLEFVKSEYANLYLENRVFSFLERMGEAYSAADLVVSRAGATSIAELAVFGLPAILIPYPAKKVHQLENAKFLEKNGAAIVIEQSVLIPWYLKEVITALMNDPERLKIMSGNSQRLACRDAASKVAMEIIGLAERRIDKD